MKLKVGALALVFACVASSASAALGVVPYNVSTIWNVDGSTAAADWGFDGNTLYQLEDTGVRSSAIMGDRFSKMYAGISGATVGGQSLGIESQGIAQTMAHSGQSVTFTGNYYLEGSLALQSLGTFEERNASVYADPNAWLGAGMQNGATTYASISATFGFTSADTLQTEMYGFGTILRITDWFDVYADYDEFGEMIGGPVITGGTTYEAYQQATHFWGGGGSDVDFTYLTGDISSIDVATNYTGQFTFEAGVDYLLSAGTSCTAGVSAATSADGGLLGALCDSTHSGYWNGINNVKDETGAPVSSFVLLTTEGVDLAFSSPLSPAPIGSGTPEPATWALLLGGFGFVGGALRRRRRTLAVA